MIKKYRKKSFKSSYGKLFHCKPAHFTVFLQIFFTVQISWSLPSENFFLGLFLVEVAGCDYRINTENRLQNTFALLLFAKERCGVGQQWPVYSTCVYDSRKHNRKQRDGGCLCSLRKCNKYLDVGGGDYYWSLMNCCRQSRHDDCMIDDMRNKFPIFTGKACWESQMIW